MEGKTHDLSPKWKNKKTEAFKFSLQNEMASGKVPSSRDRERRGCLINPRVVLKVIFFPKLPPLFIFCSSFFRTVTIQTGKRRGGVYIGFCHGKVIRDCKPTDGEVSPFPFSPFPFLKKGVLYGKPCYVQHLHFLSLLRPRPAC